MRKSILAGTSITVMGTVSVGAAVGVAVDGAPISSFRSNLSASRSKEPTSVLSFNHHCR